MTTPTGNPALDAGPECPQCWQLRSKSVLQNMNAVVAGTRSLSFIGS
jgi:hypothetical protein